MAGDAIAATVTGIVYAPDGPLPGVIVVPHADAGSWSRSHIILGAVCEASGSRPVVWKIASSIASLGLVLMISVHILGRRRLQAPAGTV